MLDENSPLPLRSAPGPSPRDEEGGYSADDTPDSPPCADAAPPCGKAIAVGFSSRVAAAAPPPALADGPVLSAEANIRIKLDDDEAEEVDSEGDGEGGGDDADADGAGAWPPTREDLKVASRRASRRSTRKNSETGRAQKARRASAVKPSERCADLREMYVSYRVCSAARTRAASAALASHGVPSAAARSATQPLSASISVRRP